MRRYAYAALLVAAIGVALVMMSLHLPVMTMLKISVVGVLVFFGLGLWTREVQR